MSLLKKFAGETVIYGLGSILPRVLTFILSIYFTRVFDTSEYAIYGVMYSFTALLLVFFTYGMETGLFRFGSQSGQLAKVFGTAAISLFSTTIFFVGVLFLFSENIATFLGEAGGGRYVRWFAVITGLDALSALPFARLRLENRPVKFAVVKILNAVIQLGLILFLLVACPFLIKNGVEWVTFIYAENKKLDAVFLANLVASGVVFLILFKDFFSFKWEFDQQLWKKMLHYSLPLIVVGVAGAINRQLPIIFLRKWLPVNAADSTGIYAACMKIAILMSLFITAFNYAAEPFFFKNVNRNDSKHIYAQIAEAFAIVGSIVFLGIMLYMDVVGLLIGKDFRAGLVVVPILLLAYFGLGLFYNFSIWYKLTDNTRIGAWISVGGAIITIVVNYIFIPKIGILAPAWAALFCYAFMAAVSYFIGKKYYPIDYPIGRIMAYVFVAVGFFYLSEIIRPYFNENIIQILLVNTLLMVSFLGMVYWSKPLKKLPTLQK